jgi:hypothetical protein
MGPLVVTGVWIEAGGYDPAALREVLSGPFDVRDSKAVFSRRGLGRGETAALSIVGALTGRRLERATDLLGGIASSRCDREDPFPCDVGELTLPLWAGRDAVEDRTTRLGRALRDAGVSGSGIECEVVCARALNRALVPAVSKLDLDLELFLAVAGRMRGRWAGPGEITCGRIGNRKTYGPRLGEHRVLVETRERSEYAVPSLGVIRFVLDADASDPLVSMASLVGKYAREVQMEAIHRNASRLVPGLARPSGYRDPVTAAFLEAAGPAIGGSGVPRECMERRR